MTTTKAAIVIIMATLIRVYNAYGQEVVLEDDTVQTVILHPGEIYKSPGVTIVKDIRKEANDRYLMDQYSHILDEYRLKVDDKLVSEDRLRGAMNDKINQIVKETDHYKDMVHYLDKENDKLSVKYNGCVKQRDEYYKSSRNWQGIASASIVVNMVLLFILLQ